jgi:hypothetical protein
MTNEIDRAMPFDVIAFVGALVLAPVAVTALSFFLVIPLFALPLGGPIYLIIGTPILLWMVGRYPPQAWRFALAGFLANLTLCALVFAADRFIPSLAETGFGENLYLALWGLVFAPIWAAAFALLYRRFNRMARLVPQS